MTRPRYALVTGASMGLGKFFAQALAARKRNLILVARSKNKLEALASELRASHAILAEPLAFDLASPTAGQRLAEHLRERDLRINLLVNNAGFGLQGEFWNLTLERQREMIYLHNAAVVELTYHLLPAMIEERRGGIINVSSTAGFQPIPYATLYAATKSFLTTFSVGLEHEVRRHGISVVTVCPGRLRAIPEDEEGQNEKRKKVPGGEQAHEDVVAETLSALDRGGGMIVPGFINKFSVFAQRLIPRSIVPKIVARLSRP